MIKKAGALVLAMLYTVTVFGFALNLHFCADILVNVKLNAPVKDCKTLSGKQMKTCKYKQIVVKVKDAHQAEAPSFIGGLLAFELPKIAFGEYLLPVQQEVLDALLNRGPPPAPPCNEVHVFVKNCNFRI
jgi:hypothetical protein